MYRQLWTLSLLVLGGCATSGQPVATCTNLISTGGGLLQFCQSNDKVQVSESGVDPSKGSNDVRIVNDPIVLKALQNEITLRPELRQSHRLVARACVVQGKDYVNISMADLKRITAVSQQPKVLSGRDLAFATR